MNLSTVINNQLMYKKRARRDLNPRPTEPESVALSTELRALTLPNYSTTLEIISRVNGCTIATHFKMQVRPSR